LAHWDGKGQGETALQKSQEEHVGILDIDRKNTRKMENMAGRRSEHLGELLKIRNLFRGTILWMKEWEILLKETV